MATDSHYQRLQGQESPASSRYVPQRGLSRYKPALQNLLPIRIHPQQSGPVPTLPVDKASFFSSISFHWLTSILWRAYRGNLQEAPLPPIDSCNINSQRLAELLHDTICKTGLKNASMSKLVWRFVRTRVIMSTLLHVIAVLISITSQVTIVNYFLVLEAPSWEDRFTWAGILIGIEILASLAKAWSHSIAWRTAGRMRMAFLGVTYKKLIRLADPGPSGHSPQKLMSDAAVIHSVILNGTHLVTAPLVIAACITLMWSDKSLVLFMMSASLVTLLLLWVLVSLSSYLSSRVSSFSIVRIARLRELIDTFMLVKMTVSDKIFTKSIGDLQKRELGYQVWSFLCDAVSESVLQAVPLITSMLVFCRIDHVKLTVNLLVIVLLFTHVKDSMFRFWIGLRSVSDAFAALSYFKEVLRLGDGEDFSERQNTPTEENQAVSISNASFAYRNKINPVKPRVRKFSRSKMLEMMMEPAPELIDISLDVAKGSIVGVVGSGKSAMLLAILGQLRAARGTSLRNGTCAYVCGATPWLIDNCDVRENILFLGKTGEIITPDTRANQNTRYYNSVLACGLNTDLDSFPLQEKTAVTDLSLTKSQAQRMALARAIYADRDIYLLDDPLSAVGVNQSKEIFKRAASGLLKGKTVIIATHYPQFLQQCNHVVRVEGTKIVGQGSHEELLKSQQVYTDLVNQPQYLEPESVPVAPNRQNGSKDTLLEASAQEGIYWARRWLVATILALTLSVAVLFTGLVLLLYIVIKYDKNDKKHGPWFEHREYASVVGAVALLFGILWRFLYVQAMKRVSRHLESDWLKRLVQAPISVLHSSRAKQDILHCFILHSRLMYGRLPFTVSRWFENVFLLLGCGGVLLLEAPWSLVPLAVLYSTSTIFIAIYRGAMLQISDSEIIKQRALQEFVQTTVKGRMTIQSLSRHNEFVSQFTSLCNAHASCLYLLDAASHWVSLRIQLLAVLFVGGMLVAIGNKPLTEPETSMCLLVAWQIGGYTRRAVRLSVAAESSVHALKHSNNLIQGLEQEVWDKKEPKGINNGGITFTDVHICPVILGASFKIDSGQHVGVLGSGRATLLTALFKLVRPSKGEISMGGMDTSRLPVNTVRGYISLIPRRAPFLSTTVRRFLDPTESYSDSELWDVLVKVRVKSRVQKLEARLRRGEEGWKVEDREGLWLAKAILDKAQIIILEECVHLKADEVRDLLPNSTVLSFVGQYTPNDAPSYDQVLTITDGKVECGKLEHLYSRSDSNFSQMLEATTTSVLETSM